MDKVCKICGKSKDLFELQFQPEDTDALEHYSVYVCESCWNIIAKIAKIVTRDVLQEGIG